MKAVVSIAGSDSSGGAGIQADIKTIAAHHLFAETVITALTAQNTLGVTGVHEVPAAFVSEQIDAALLPHPPRCGEGRHGVVGRDHPRDCRRPRQVACGKHRGRSRHGGDERRASYRRRRGVGAYRGASSPGERATTPNIPEAQVLCGCELSDEESCERAAVSLARSLGVNVLVKGGHGAHDANDVLATRSGETHWFRHEVIPTSNTHGTGCTGLSSAIACGLACGLSVPDAVAAAKEYLYGRTLGGPQSGGRGAGRF